MSTSTNFKLPPIAKKEVIFKSAAPQHLLPDQTSTKIVRNKKSLGFIRIGDIISLIAKETLNDLSYSGVISGDGFAHGNLECVPKDNFIGSSSNTEIRQVLFRIEPPYEFCGVKPSKEKQQEEIQELELNVERKITFGERFQLRHFNSRAYLTCSDDAGKEAGTLKMILDFEGSEYSWLELLPPDMLRKPGESVRYSDSFVLCILKDNTQYFVHMEPSAQVGFSELNASIAQTKWVAKRFNSYLELRQDQECIVTGNCLRIFNPKLEGYISVGGWSVFDLVPNALKRTDFVGKAEGAQVIIEKKAACMALWEIERASPFEGGKVNWTEFYRVKNIATGKFLAVSPSDPFSLILSNNGKSGDTMFKLVPESAAGEFVTFNSIVMMQSMELGNYLKCRRYERESELLQNAEKVTRFDIKLTDKALDRESLSFNFIDEPEEQTLFVFQITSLIPKLVNFYEFLSQWRAEGRLSIDNDSKYHDSQLKNEVDFVIEALKNLNMNILGVDATLFKSIKSRQNAMRATGALDLLIEIALLSDKKLELPPTFPKEWIPSSIKKSNIRILQMIVENNLKEYMSYTQVIASPHLFRLMLRLFESIYMCIKLNYSSCIGIMHHDSFFAKQLTSYRVPVGRILREIFKSSGISSGATHRAQFWIGFLKPLSEQEDNLEEQVIALKILASLCMNRGEGVSWFQKTIESSLFSPDRTNEYVTFLLINDKPAVRISGGSQLSLPTFLSNNPILKSLTVPLGLEMKEPNILFVDCLSNQLKYSDYIAVHLKLLAALSLSRNESASDHIVRSLGLSFDHILSAMKSPQIHHKTRSVYARLCKLLFVDRNPYKSILHTKQLCYCLDANYNLEEREDTGEAPTILSNPSDKPFLIETLVQ